VKPATPTDERLQHVGGMRVAMVSARYDPYVGGIETHVREVAGRLVERGIDLTVLTTHRGERSVEHRGGFTIERHRTVGRPEDLHLSPSLVRSLVNGGFDAVHVQGINTALPFLALPAAHRLGIPSVVTLHTGGHSSRVRTLGRVPQWRALGPSLRRCARVIGVCQFEIETFVRHAGVDRSRCSVIHNGAERLPVGHSDPLLDGAPLVLSVGRLERYKGHQRVIAAMPEMLRRAPGARLGIVGSGPHEQALRRQVAEAGLGRAVSFASFGPDEREELGTLLARADVVTLMSDYEAHPVAIMEALALGTPAVVADGSGLSELGRWALVRTVARDTVPQLLTRELLQAARTDVASPAVELPTWDDCADRLVGVYTDVVRCAS